MKKNTLISGLLGLMLLPGCQTSQRPDGSQIHTFGDFPSQYVAPRNVEVWLPAGYNPDQRYDVLYMHDGQNVFNPATSYTGVTWGVAEATDSLLGGNAIREPIIVAVWNTENRFIEYMPYQPREKIRELAREMGAPEPISDQYLKFLVMELKPFIDSTFSTNPQASSTFIMGSSMGGLISMYAVCEYPEVFGAAACLSTHWPIGDGIFIEYLENNLPDPATHRLYFDHGTINLDSLYEPYQQRVDALMREKGFEHGHNWITLKAEGADHNEQAWQNRIHLPLKFLLRKEE